MRSLLLPRNLPLLLLLLSLVSGCSFIRPAPQYDRREVTPRPGVEQPGTGQQSEIDSQREQQLRSFIAEWWGVPYRWGGNDRNGVDCSGLVQIAMRDLFGVELPRSTAYQINSGASVPSQSALRSGDLVFFSIQGERHVALFLGHGEIGHATTSQGVTISTLGSFYWSESFFTARRVLD